MKTLILILLCISSTILIGPKSYYPSYEPEYVEVSTTKYGDNVFHMVSMNRKDNRVKAKYFAAKDFNGRSVFERYNEWKSSSVILTSSGTYMDECNISQNPKPVGLTIDNGVIVNERFETGFDGLVIVYATGGVVVSNLKEGNLKIKCEGLEKVFDIRKSLDRQQFISCAESVEATVFQTHLLAWKNELKIYDAPGCKSPPCARERRFLAVCKDEEGDILHIIVHSPTPSTLYQGTKKVFEFLREFKEMEEVVFMINLDTGCQDVFQLYNKDGVIRYDIRGRMKVSDAVNLLVYYFE